MNKTLRWVVIVSALVAVVGLGTATILYFNAGLFREDAKGLPVDELRSFTVAGISEIAVGSSSSDVLIGRSRSQEIEVRLHGTVHAGRRDLLPLLAARRDAEQLSIQCEQRDRRGFFLGWYSADLRLELGLPESYASRLKVRTSSGDVQISGQALSELSVDTSSGDVSLSDIRASLILLESSSGDLKGGGLDVPGAAPAGGPATQPAGVRARSSSGDIGLGFLRLNGELQIRSSSGDVILSLPAEPAVRLQARSSSGEVTCQFPITLAGAGAPVRRNTLEGLIGPGTFPVEISTSSGDIEIRR